MEISKKHEHVKAGMRQDQEMIRPTLRKAEHFNVSPERYKQQAWRHAAIRLCIDPMVIAACVLGLVVPVAVAYVMKDPAWIFLGYGSIVLVGITAGIRAGKHVPSEVPPMCRKCGFDLRGTDERERCPECGEEQREEVGGQKSEVSRE